MLGHVQGRVEYETKLLQVLKNVVHIIHEKDIVSWPLALFLENPLVALLELVEAVVVLVWSKWQVPAHHHQKPKRLQAQMTYGQIHISVASM